MTKYILDNNDEFYSHVKECIEQLSNNEELLFHFICDSVWDHDGNWDTPNPPYIRSDVRLARLKRSMENMWKIINNPCMRGLIPEDD